MADRDDEKRGVRRRSRIHIRRDSKRRQKGIGESMTAKLIPLFPEMEEVRIPTLLQPWQRHTPPFIHPSQTSQDASISILPKQRTLQERVFAAICDSVHGLTDKEISEVTGLSENTARPRRIELTNAGRIQSAGTRPTKSGRQAQIWIVK